MIFGYKNLQVWYQELGDLTRYSDYSLTELKQMIPYELMIFQSILMTQLEEEKKRANHK